LFWFNFANGSLMPSLMIRMCFGARAAATSIRSSRTLVDRAERAFQLVEQRLGAAPYLSGSAFTAADIIMYFPLNDMPQHASTDLAQYPSLDAYLRRIRARDGFQRALAVGGRPL
jgi:glutathione S-transferase